ncbi:MAG: hypothetical protein K2H60_00420, partial [Muribaculaceae bacterium]|nr:hypothetical protein [Muribaculaceae bacterium]
MFWFLPVIFGSLLAGGIAGSLVALVINLFIDEDTISDEIRSRNEFQDAFKALIKSKNTRTV